MSGSQPTLCQAACGQAPIDTHTFGYCMGHAQWADRTPAMAFLDHHIDIRKLSKVFPGGRPFLANNRINFCLGPEFTRIVNWGSTLE